MEGGKSILVMDNYNISDFMKRYTINKNAKFKSNCLEFKLEERLTNALPENEKLKLLIAVSGGGKTRRIYEELYKSHGVFFTCAKQNNGGSEDLALCLSDSISTKDSTRYFRLLFASRIMILKWLEEEYKMLPYQLLLAQIHPKEMFGADIFYDFYKALILKFTGIEWLKFDSKYWLAIDEIQMAIQGPNVFIYSSTARPVLAPLVKAALTALSSYGKLVLAGTGMDYQTLRDVFASGSMKNSLYDIVSDFRPMTGQQVLFYSKMILCDLGKLNHEVDDVAERLSKDSLFVPGRPRFLSSVLDAIISDTESQLMTEKLDKALLIFHEILSNPSSFAFPIRYWDARKNCLINSSTYELLAVKALTSYLRGKNALFLKSHVEDDLADLINMGIGYPDYGSGGLYLCEETIVECLFVLINPKLLAQEFMSMLTASVNSSVAGFNFEYIILIKFYCDDPQRNITILRGSLPYHLDGLFLEIDGCYIILPDNNAGNYI
jgi:hypothetical protein